MARISAWLWGLFSWIHRCAVYLSRLLVSLCATTVGRLPVHVQLALAWLIACACPGLYLAAGQDLVSFTADINERQVSQLQELGFWHEYEVHRAFVQTQIALMLCAAACACWRRPLSYLLHHVAWACAFLCTVIVCGALHAAPSILFALDAADFPRYMRNEAWARGIAITTPLLAGLLLLFALIRRQAVAAGYGQPTTPRLGDRLLPQLRVGGDDPQFTSSVSWAVALHLGAILLLPVLLRGCGWEAPYAVPQGTGDPVILAEVRRVKKEVKREKLVLSRNTDILFYRIDPDESDVLAETEQITQFEYQARGVEGKPGAAGGELGGWPQGMPGKVRFIRLKYSGGDWDQDLKLAADDNMLFKLGQMTGLPVASRAEQRAINRLRFFPQGKAPPFVFVTGAGGISITSQEARILRDYCLKEGGMIFADNGGGRFNNALRAAIKRVFPDKRWVVVSKDDQIFQYPYLFPGGAPPFWHHSGRDVLGIRHHGRWVVFYHQGDLNDAWKNGHSGVHEGLANQAYKLGVNVVHYAFTQYLSQHQ